ncbi:MAG TPA: alginate lyase family protein [Tepidisphaeraceae bacterium]|nr:alginate lyase family protein [Tepidisphaeraceae bacterium]
MNNLRQRCVNILVGILLLCAGGAARAAEFKFVHPGLLNSKDDLARMKAAVAAKEEPIYSGYEAFAKHVESQANYTMKGPRESVGRGQGWTGPAQGIYDADANAAYQCAIMWCITGDKAYAEKSKQILNAWSSTLKTIGGRDAVLGAGLGPFKMVCAAEIIRHSDAGWSDADIKQTEKCFKEAVYPVIQDFSPFANGNWDTAAIKTVMAIGVFCNDRDIYERGLRYYVNGAGNGRLTYYVINEAGECQETGRDSQHSQLGMAHLADASEVAWNQGLNLYGYADNRLLKGFEYTAAHNGGEGTPFVEWMDRTGDSHYFRPSAPGDYRAVYEEVYNHYANRMGMPAPHTEKAAKEIRPEGQGVRGPQGINGADHIGFGTLLFTRPKNAEAHKSSFGVPAAPGAIVAHGDADGIKLTWIESVDAVSYTVKRADTRGGPYSVVAKDVKGSTYTDKAVKPGQVYYYVASATNASGESADAYETSACAGLPTPWKQQDIGHPVPPGWTQFDGRVFTVEGGGSAIGGTSDQLQFAYLPLDGDGAITVRHVPQVSSQHLQFGLLMRETTDADSAQIACLIQRADRGRWATTLLTRPTTGAGSAEIATQPLDAPTVTQGRLLQPCWLRLTRAGKTFTASFSTDGKEWMRIGSTDAGLKSHLLVGIGACSRLVSPNASATTTVMMDQVSVTGWNPPSGGK